MVTYSHEYVQELVEQVHEPAKKSSPDVEVMTVGIAIERGAELLLTDTAIGRPQGGDQALTAGAVRKLAAVEAKAAIKKAAMLSTAAAKIRARSYREPARKGRVGYGRLILTV